jgi:uncharacterized protein GlcG (DUF336 family)
MDGTPYGFVEISRSRAWTASAFKVDSHKVVDLVGSMLESPNGEGSNERFNTTPGGVYVGDVIGAIGIAGNTPEEDYKIAKSVLKLINF